MYSFMMLSLCFKTTHKMKKLEAIITKVISSVENMNKDSREALIMIIVAAIVCGFLQNL